MRVGGRQIRTRARLAGSTIAGERGTERDRSGEKRHEGEAAPAPLRAPCSREGAGRARDRLQRALKWRGVALLTLADAGRCAIGQARDATERRALDLELLPEENFPFLVGQRQPMDAGLERTEPREHILAAAPFHAAPHLPQRVL